MVAWLESDRAKESLEDSAEAALVPAVCHTTAVSDLQGTWYKWWRRVVVMATNNNGYMCRTIDTAKRTVHTD